VQSTLHENVALDVVTVDANWTKAQAKCLAGQPRITSRIEDPAIDGNLPLLEEEVNLVTVPDPLREVVEVLSIVLQPATVTATVTCPSEYSDIPDDTTASDNLVMAPFKLVTAGYGEVAEADDEVLESFGMLHRGYRQASTQTTASKPEIEVVNTGDTEYLSLLFTDFTFLSHEEDDSGDGEEDTGLFSDQAAFTGGSSPISSSSSSSSSTSTMSENEEKEVTEGTEDEQDEEEGGVTRADWEPLRSLTSSNFTKILAYHLGGVLAVEGSDFEFMCQREGGFNHVRLYKLTHIAKAATYLVKVPCVGTAARWQPQDAHMLRSKYGTMKLIRERTKCPVPEVAVYDDTLTNNLGTPYIIMKACTDVQALDVWYDEDEDGG
jgi:hypothetical protein